MLGEVVVVSGEEMVGAVCGERAGVGVRGCAVWRGKLAVGKCYVSAMIGRWVIYPVGTRPCAEGRAVCVCVLYGGRSVDVVAIVFLAGVCLCECLLAG